MIKCDSFLFSLKFFFLGLYLFAISIGLASNPDIYQHEEHDLPLTDSPGLLKILSIDGGGIRGIIPASLLMRLEELSGKPIAKSFEAMAGTSTGGILTLGLNARNVKDEEKIPLYSASDMLNIYTKRGSEIFQQSFYPKVSSGMGLMTYKYDSDGLNKITSELLGDLKLSDSITNTLITGYEIERDEPYFFKSILAKSKDEYNFYMRDVVRATSAAPVYFQPARIRNLAGGIFSFIDGGVILNNPTLAVTIHGKNLFPKVEPRNYMVISLGTGNATRSISYDKVKNAGGLGWVGKIIPLMMDGASHVVDYQMLHVLPDTEGMKNYFRFQPNIPSDLSEMDNTHPENIRKLKMIGEKSAQIYFDDLLQLIAKNIRENRKFSTNLEYISPRTKFTRAKSVFLNSDSNDNYEYEAIIQDNDLKLLNLNLHKAKYDLLKTPFDDVKDDENNEEENFIESNNDDDKGKSDKSDESEENAESGESDD